MSDAWSPSQYERFRTERAQPFWDLAALVERGPGMRVADTSSTDASSEASRSGRPSLDPTKG